MICKMKIMFWFEFLAICIGIASIGLILFFLITNGYFRGYEPNNYYRYSEITVGIFAVLVFSIMLLDKMYEYVGKK